MNIWDVFLWYTPLRGVTKDAMKMRWAKSYTSFHAIPHGKQDDVETVGCRWHQRSRIVWRHVSSESSKYLGCYHSRATNPYVARRFSGSRNIIPLVVENLLDIGFIIYSSFQTQAFETIRDPPTFPCLEWCLWCCCLLLLMYYCIVEYYDGLREFIRAQQVWVSLFLSASIF